MSTTKTAPKASAASKGAPKKSTSVELPATFWKRINAQAEKSKVDPAALVVCLVDHALEEMERLVLVVNRQRDQSSASESKIGADSDSSTTKVICPGMNIEAFTKPVDWIRVTVSVCDELAEIFQRLDEEEFVSLLCEEAWRADPTDERAKANPDYIKDLRETLEEHGADEEDNTNAIQFSVTKINWDAFLSRMRLYNSTPAAFVRMTIATARDKWLQS